MHSYPEPGFKEFKTQERIRSFLVSLGIEETEIKVSGKTGLTLDIRGTSAALGAAKIIAFRADIDALTMTE
jgi:metal-dependent amidase/aminoacylase/carboxypeptidase family protein